MTESSKSGQEMPIVHRRDNTLYATKLAPWFERLLMRYLRRRGWVVFWLDEPAQHCSAVCWLHEYRQGQGLPDLKRATQDVQEAGE